MNLFVHHEGALGDVLMSLPCLRFIAGEGTVHFAGRADVGALLRETGVAGEASSSGSALYAPLHGGRADEKLRAFLGRFGRAVVFTVDTGSPVVAAVREVIPDTAPVATVPPRGSPMPAAMFRLAQLGGAPGDSSGGPLLAVPPVYRELVSGMLGRTGYDGQRPLIAVHPGSGGVSKRWPLERFLAVVERLQIDIDPFVLILSGPAEDDAFKDSLDGFVRGRFGAVHYADLDLIAVAALLSASDLYLGNDAGVTHLAAALGCRVVALFGATDPVVWGPAGPAVTILHAQDLGSLSVDAVASRVGGLLAAPVGPPQERRRQDT